MAMAAENRMRVARGQYEPKASIFRRTHGRNFRMSKKPRQTPTEIEAQRIAAAVAGQLGASLADIRSPRRTADLLDARRLIAHRARAAGASLPEIGRVIGRDHSTVINALRRFSEQTEGGSRDGG